MAASGSELDVWILDPDARPHGPVGKIHWARAQWKALKVSTWITRILDYGAPLLWKSGPPPPKVIKQFPCTALAERIISRWVDNSLSKGEIVEVNTRPKVLSPIFILPKINQPNEYRTVIDLRFLNSFLRSRNFKVDSLDQALNAMTPSCWFTKTDIASAFSHIKIARAFRKYLGFRIGNRVFTYKVLPFGLALSPYIFTKTLKPVVKLCRSRGIFLIVYVDDILIISPSMHQCSVDTSFLRSRLSALGWEVRWDKSTSPNQEVEFLGFHLDSRDLSLSLPPRKAHRLAHEFRRFTRRFSTTPVPRRMAARICGLASSIARAIPLAAALSRRLMFAVKAHPGPWDAKITVPVRAMVDIETLAEMVSHLQRVPIFSPNPTLVLRTDSSLLGWGAFCPTTGAAWSGPWTTSDQVIDLQSINVLEMLAVHRALQSLNPPPRSIVLVETDNATTVAYLRRWAGRQPHLFDLTRTILDWCLKKEVTLQIRHVPGCMNTEADRLSRTIKDWELTTAAFSKMCNLLSFRPQVDRFATATNRKLKRFNSRMPHPEAEATNGLTQDWSQATNYWAPPLSLLFRTVCKIRAEMATGIVITPDWEGPWLPLLLNLADLVLPIPTATATKSEGSPFETASSRLLAWRISGTQNSPTSTHETEPWWSRVTISPTWVVSLRI